MGLTSSKLFQISFSFSDIIEKVRCYSACGQVIIEDRCEFEESDDKKRQEHSGDDHDFDKIY